MGMPSLAQPRKIFPAARYFSHHMGHIHTFRLSCAGSRGGAVRTPGCCYLSFSAMISLVR